MLITWWNCVSNYAGKGVWLMDGRWDGGLAKADCPDWESGFRMNQPTPNYTRWFRHEKFVGTYWGTCGTYWGSAWFAVNYLHIADVAISDTGHQIRDARCWQPLNTVLVQSDDDGVAKDTIIEIQRWVDDNGVVPVITVKKGVPTKKNYRTFEF